jgi:hypothetical protein
MFKFNYRSKALASILLASALAVSVAESPKISAIAIDAEVDLNAFVSAATLAEYAAQGSTHYPDTVLTIPVIYIYSPSGDLIYHETGDDRIGHESVNGKNIAMLQGLPMSAEHLTPIANTPNLKAMLDIIPAFKDKEQTLIGNGHYVVYAVTPKVDRITTTQKAVLALRDRAKDLPIDTLILHIQY